MLPIVFFLSPVLASEQSTATLKIPVLLLEDDAEESGGNVNTNIYDLELGDKLCGIRFDTYVFALDYKTGLTPIKPIFDLNGDGNFNEDDDDDDEVKKFDVNIDEKRVKVESWMQK